MTVANVAASAPATSAWANTVADDVNATTPDNVVASTQAVGDAATSGAATKAARRDHKHGLPDFGNVTAETTAGTSSSNGAAATVARSDHGHGNPAATALGNVTAQTTYGAASANGASASASHTDHTHGTPALPTATQVGALAAYNTPATAAGGKRAYIGTSTPTGASEGDIWIKG